MTCNYQKSTKRMLFASSFALLMLFSGMYSIQHAFADDIENDFIPVASDRIKNDPFLVKILENMEKSKKQFSDIQQKNVQKELLDDKRSEAKSIVEKELQQMFKENEDFTSIISFNRFLDKVSKDETKIIFQGLFDYKEDRVNAARDAMKEVFKNGGSLLDARNVYHETAKIPRVDMIQLVQDLNIKAGFSDPDIQQYFSSEGKLPRYDDESESVISFVDYNTSAPNVNSSSNSSTKETVQHLDDDNKTNDNIDSNEITVQNLLNEIQLLKNKIKELEQKQDGTIHQTVLEQRDNDSLHFAKWIVDYKQELSSDGKPVNPERSATINALNEPNSYDKSISFFTLGSHGELIVSFERPVSGDLVVYEASWGKITTETASIEVSTDNKNWIPLTKVSYSSRNLNVHEFEYDLSTIGCIQYVKITDTTPVSLSSDGFDVDAVAATQACTDTT